VPPPRPVDLNTQQLDPSWQSELLAYEGHHLEAAKLYARSGKVDEAIRLFVDLRRWEDAKLFAKNSGQADISSLTAQQAKWLQEINDWKGAAELYVSMGQHMQAAKIVVEAFETGWQAALIDVVRACPAEQLETLQYCGEAFGKADEDAFARETYLKAGDISKLMALYARRQMWAEAAKLAEEHEGKFDVAVFLPYAEWLVSQDRYEEAMSAYKKAGRKDLSKKVIQELTYNAVSESRFKDSAYYYWLLSKEADNDMQEAEAEHKADLYFAYASVHAYVTDPFTSHQPDLLFQVSRFIINSLGSSDVIPYGISKAATLYTLAKQAMTLGAFKLARHAYDRLGKLQVLPRKQDEIELDMLIVQAKPVRDDPDHLPVCYRCSSTNPLLNPFTNKIAKGDVCTNCGHPFVRSFINFEVLPLVEFIPMEKISDEEAIDLIRQPPTSDGKSRRGSDGGGDWGRGSGSGGGGKWKEGKEGKADMMTLDNDTSGYGGGYDNDYNNSSFSGVAGSGHDDRDLFTSCLNSTLERQVQIRHLI
jgi:intraflagellar transport protein 122